MQLLLASKGYQKQFESLKCIVNDEWHELLGTKRAVQMELAQSRLKRICPRLKIWGISATIGNMEEGIEVLLGDDFQHGNHELVIANIKKKIDLGTLIPEEVEKFPWAGHLGIKMLKQVVPVIRKSKTTLIFTNTRSQCETWYQRLLEEEPDLAGQIAMHHGSIGKEIREWVEDALHTEKLKAVVCTSSLDLVLTLGRLKPSFKLEVQKELLGFYKELAKRTPAWSNFENLLCANPFARNN